MNKFGSTRRGFLKAMGQVSLGMLVNGSIVMRTLAQTKDPMMQHDYTGWENFHREQWSWDKKTRGTHLLNCTGSCPHFVYTKNGVVMREEQSKDMPKLSGVPEYNPRGCNKGECAVDYQYGPHRIKYPLIRVGERGEGKWRRVSWDEALEYVANGIVDTIKNDASDCISVFTPVPAVAPVSFAAGHRFASFIGGHTHTFFDWYGDHPTGQTQVQGLQGDTCETADWYNGRTILMWGANSASTRIPDAHFLQEAVLNGSKMYVISPDFNSTATKADVFVPIKPGTDAALALSMVNVIVKEKLYDEHNLKEQTDLPFLIRTDTKMYLREADMVEGGSEEKFYTWDTKTNKPVLMKGSWGEQPETKAKIQPGFMGRNTFVFPDGHLDLGDLDPALEGTFKVKLVDGVQVNVQPVFEAYKPKLNEYTPENVSKITGVAPSVIIQMARDFAMNKPSMIITGGGTNHWYWSDTVLRSFILLCAMTGNEGYNGTGVNHYVGQWKPTPLLGVVKLSFPHSPKKHRFCQTTIWTYYHGNVYDAMENENIDTAKYLRESLQTGQMPLYPQNGRDPKVFICYRGNWLNNAKGLDYVLRNLWPKMNLTVDMNFRMDSTALYSDVVLPSAHWYEKTDLSMTEEHSFIHMTEPAIAPLWESKPDWEIFALLSKKVGEVAKKKGFTKYFDEKFNIARDLTKLHDQQTDGGKLATDEQACQFILDNAPQTQGMTLEMIRKEGPQRFKSNWTSPMKEGVPYTPLQHFIQKKKPWPTLTGREQFYIDHPTFFDLGVEFPVYKAPVDADQYPLRFNTPHSRYSIHSTWKDNVLQQRLQRGGPSCEISPVDAKARGIKDNDWVEVFNDHGRVVVRCKIRNGEQSGRVSMHHEPELYVDLLGGGNSQSPLPVRINPTALVGNYAHLTFKPNYYGPGGVQRDARVEVRRYTGSVTV
ncbi:molybdopterin-dependent oxidoreductase [Sedimenticola selenatireducens]|uniref:Molybdopterin oxidoreductase n=1 Tax=Sedimenticola selenatireducens TaxID=191960 RepID=A0A2N6CRG8_9GAMM|nr:molybdopterin-dependent oxidoreductase [Sedimenticola selenatireducens]PLX59662.1 MAG: molybdopterin oxidoreductase [Sedimenticola selenatireducens]